MPATIKKGSPSTNHGNAIVSKHVQDYSKDPVFVKKTEAAKAILEKFGFPDNNQKKK